MPPRSAFVEFEGQRYFRSGDLGRVDEDGYFFITDRLKRMINASGFKVWPAEVEALMFRHPAIAEACVIGTRDDYRGESVKAVVVLRAEARGQVSEQEIVDWCRENMAVYKCPRVVQFVEALPKSGSGKVMWRLLQEQEARPEREPLARWHNGAWLPRSLHSPIHWSRLWQPQTGPVLADAGVQRHCRSVLGWTLHLAATHGRPVGPDHAACPGQCPAWAGG